MTPWDYYIGLAIVGAILLAIILTDGECRCYRCTEAELLTILSEKKERRP